MAEWETGEITEEPLSLKAADDPVTCAVYAQKQYLLHLDGWKRHKHIAKNQKHLTRAINQSKIRQEKRSAVYQFGLLIPKDYKQALQLDEQNCSSSSMMPPDLRWTKSMNRGPFKTMEKPRLIPNRGWYQMPQIYTRKSGFTSSLLSNMMADTRLDWLPEDMSLQILLIASTLELLYF